MSSRDLIELGAVRDVQVDHSQGMPAAFGLFIDAMQACEFVKSIMGRGG